ncbi:MAG: DUF4271 domain-containing protein [Bacteroidota bacterium]
MRLIVLFLSFSFLVLFSFGVQAKLNTARYGVVIDTAALKLNNQKVFDSTINKVVNLQKKKTVNFIAKPHVTENNTLDFYLLLCLCAILGAIKTVHPKYFNDVWRAFINPTLGSRQLKDIIQSATFPNLLMNLYSSAILGIYVYYLISISIDWRFVGVPSGLIVSLLILGSVLMYIVKFSFIQFTGWAFNIRSTTEQYNFNIFLVNKILGIVLTPFVICFAFLNDKWNTPLCIISILLLVILILNRYLRSWNIFAQFFMNSRFHFFMYLCAFEILPIVVLLKLVLRIL